MLSIQARRAAVYVGGGALLVAWLAAANTTRRPDPLPPPAAHDDPAHDVAVSLREEGAQLRGLLSHAPAPSANSRNPFKFAPVLPPRAAAPRHATETRDAAPVPDAPPPLPLTLMGIAEQPAAAGPERTAILALRQAQGDPEQGRGVGGAGDEIYMVTVGQTIAARYSVTAIGVDAIELKDLATGGLRRLALK